MSTVHHRYQVIEWFGGDAYNNACEPIQTRRDAFRFAGQLRDRIIGESPGGGAEVYDLMAHAGRPCTWRFDAKNDGVVVETK